MEDLNDVVQGMATKIAHAEFKKEVYKVFEVGKSIPDKDNLAITIDCFRTKFGIDFTSLFTLWFKEWKESKCK